MLKRNSNNIHNNTPVSRTTLGDLSDIREIAEYLYTADEISEFRMDEAINDSPLATKNTRVRSKLAYKEILNNTKPTKNYLLPGQVVLFNYRAPKYSEDLMYYDGTPLTIFFGITRTTDGNIREVGFNLHYYPPYARLIILNKVYETYKAYYKTQFNEVNGKPNRFINYNLLRNMLRNQKISFGLRMYIPVLRGTSYVIPTRLIPVAYYTEGHFAKETLANIQRYWRKTKK